jgi:nucleoid-associated protein YgaU
MDILMKRLLVVALIEFSMIGCTYASKRQVDEIDAREKIIGELKKEVKNAEATLWDLEKQPKKTSDLELDELNKQEKPEESSYTKMKLTPAEANVIITTLKEEEENLKAELLELLIQIEARKSEVADTNIKIVEVEREKTISEKSPEQIFSYKVKRRDYLSKIAERSEIYGHGKYRKWKEIYNANRDKIKDQNLILPGWDLKIPKQ